MKKFILIVFALIFVQTLFAQKQIKWDTFDAGLKKAKVSGKKVLVDVYTDWCGWCKKMDAHTYTDPKVQEYLNKNFVIIKLNAEGNEKLTFAGQSITPPEFTQGMGITGFPATLFLQSDGKPITVLPGYAEADMFLHVLSFIGENHYEKKKFADYLAEKGVKQ
jgi:thioredoxin-related protein